MSLSSKRHTQFDLLALTKAKPVPSRSELPQLQSPEGDLEKKTLSKKRARSPVEHTPGTVADARKKFTRLDQIQATGLLRPIAAKESPWKYYEKIYDLELAGNVQVAVRKTDPIELVHVRLFNNPEAEKALHSYRNLQHVNIVTALDAFPSDTGLHLVLEAMPISLERLVQSPAYPDERQLAAILGQLLNGVAYLEAEGFEHRSLCCSNILLDTDGTLKIANQECCGVMSQSKSGRHDLRALSSIMMELMQKYVKEDAAVGIDDLHRWHSSSDAVGLLSATTSAVSAAELLKHPLLTRSWNKSSLIGLISLAQACVRGRYKYTP